MAEVLPRHYIIAILIFTIVIVGGVALISEFRSDDASFVDADKFSTFNTTFNKYDDIVDISEKTQDNIENMEDTDFGIFGVLNSLINQAWQFLRLLISSLGFMTAAFNGLATIFGVPAWLPTLILSIIVIIIGFSIYSAIFQRDV